MVNLQNEIELASKNDKRLRDLKSDLQKEEHNLIRAIENLQKDIKANVTNYEDLGAYFERAINLKNDKQSELCQEIDTLNKQKAAIEESHVQPMLNLQTLLISTEDSLAKVTKEKSMVEGEFNELSFQMIGLQEVDKDNDFHLEFLKSKVQTSLDKITEKVSVAQTEITSSQSANYELLNSQASEIRKKQKEEVEGKESEIEKLQEANLGLDIQTSKASILNYFYLAVIFAVVATLIIRTLFPSATGSKS